MNLVFMVLGIGKTPESFDVSSVYRVRHAIIDTTRDYEQSTLSLRRLIAIGVVVDSRWRASCDARLTGLEDAPRSHDTPVFQSDVDRIRSIRPASRMKIIIIPWMVPERQLLRSAHVSVA